jgi:hypothetical protein
MSLFLTITNYIFLFAMLFVIACLPFLIILIALIILKKKIGISFKISGFYQLSDFLFELEDEKIKFEIFIEKIQIKLVWLRIRILISGIKCSCYIKTSSPDPFQSGVQEFNRKLNTLNTFNDSEKVLENIKSKFWSINNNLYNNFNNNLYNNNKNQHLSKRVKNLYDPNGDALKSLDELVEHYPQANRISDIVRKILLFVDIEVSEIQAKIKFEMTKDSTHLVTLGKIIIGVVKGETKVKQFNI